MTIYVKNLKELRTPTTKLVDLLCNYSKVAGYKAIIQKSIAFLYTSNKQVKFEIKNTVSFILACKNRKYIDTCLTKYIENLHE